MPCVQTADPAPISCLKHLSNCNRTWRTLARTADRTLTTVRALLEAGSNAARNANAPLTSTNTSMTRPSALPRETVIPLLHVLDPHETPIAILAVGLGRDTIGPGLTTSEVEGKVKSAGDHANAQNGSVVTRSIDRPAMAQSSRNVTSLDHCVAAITPNFSLWKIELPSVPRRIRLTLSLLPPTCRTYLSFPANFLNAMEEATSRWI